MAGPAGAVDCSRSAISWPLAGPSWPLCSLLLGPALPVKSEVRTENRLRCELMFISRMMVISKSMTDIADTRSDVC